MIDPMDAKQHDPKDVADNKDLAALGYVWVLSLVVLFAKRDSAFVQFHARQGAVLFGLSLVVWAMPFVGKLAELLVLALCLVGFLHAAQSEWKEVPIVGPLSRGSIADLRNSWKDVVAACASLWARVRGVPKQPKADDAAHPAQPAPAPVIDVPMAAPEPAAPAEDPHVELVDEPSPAPVPPADMPRAFVDVSPDGPVSTPEPPTDAPPSPDDR